MFGTNRSRSYDQEHSTTSRALQYQCREITYKRNHFLLNITQITSESMNFPHRLAHRLACGEDNDVLCSDSPDSYIAQLKLLQLIVDDVDDVPSIIINKLLKRIHVINLK